MLLIPNVERRTVSLEGLEPQIAVWPNPDNVQSVTELADKPFDIAFVGTCTTGPTDFVLACLVAEAADKAGWKPIEAGEMARLVSPSSMGIAEMLRGYDLIRPLEELGFKVGKPGCGLCIGGDGFAASPGQWVLGSHNRTFEDRTGKGSFSMAANAVVVVASSTRMKVTDPRQLLEHFDAIRYERILADLNGTALFVPEICRTEPNAQAVASSVPTSWTFEDLIEQGVVCSRVVKFGDNVDTDAIIPIDYCHHDTLEPLGQGAFANRMGEGVFRNKVVNEGKGAVVAGEAWGCGSSREHAVFALQGAEVQLIVAKSFAYIHRRNLVSQALPFRAIHPDDQEALHNTVGEGTELEVDLNKNTVTIVGDPTRVFRLLPIDPVEQAIQSLGGLAKACNKYGAQAFDAIIALADQFRGNTAKEGLVV